MELSINHQLPLQILTKDSVTVFVNAIMYYKVRNPIHAVANVDDYSGSARLLAATTLRSLMTRHRHDKMKRMGLDWVKAENGEESGKRINDVDVGDDDDNFVDIPGTCWAQ